MKRLIALAAVLAAVLLVTLGAAPASAHRPANCGLLRPRAELRCARAQLHHARSELRHPTTRNSPAYWRWRERVARRWIRRAHYRLSHPPLKYRALWLCIHHYEGAWNDADSGHNGHYGGLQMTDPWTVYGHVLVTRADYLSPYAQMHAAETGWKMVVARQGYSYARYTWLPGQWNHPDCIAAHA